MPCSLPAFLRCSAPWRTSRAGSDICFCPQSTVTCLPFRPSPGPVSPVANSFQWGIISFGLSLSTIEEVFLRIAKEVPSCLLLPCGALPLVDWLMDAAHSSDHNFLSPPLDLSASPNEHLIAMRSEDTGCENGFNASCKYTSTVFRGQTVSILKFKNYQKIRRVALGPIGSTQHLRVFMSPVPLPIRCLR